jgi:hypothetical protein
MTKRSTIGTNPLDEIIPNPLGSALSDQHTGPEQSAFQEEGTQENGITPAGQHSVPGRVHHDKKEATRRHPVSRDDGPQRKSKNSHEGPAPAAQLHIEVLPATGQLSERLVELEEENLCLKWALGLILAPLVLLAFLG